MPNSSSSFPEIKFDKIEPSCWIINYNNGIVELKLASTHTNYVTGASVWQISSYKNEWNVCYPNNQLSFFDGLIVNVAKGT